MPLQLGRRHIGDNIKAEEAAGKPPKQALAIALHTAGVPKRRKLTDPQPFKAADHPSRDFRGEKMVNGVKMRV